MTEKNILIALECCTDAELGHCLECPYELNCIKNGTNLLAFDTHNLVKELQAKNKSLQEYQNDMQDLIFDFRKDQAEIKFLRKNIENEAVKKFVSRIHELIHEAELHGAYEPDIGCIIDEILKEMEIELK